MMDCQNIIYAQSGFGCCHWVYLMCPRYLHWPFEYKVVIGLAWDPIRRIHRLRDVKTSLETQQAQRATFLVLYIHIYQFLDRNLPLWEELIAYFLWYDTGHIVNDASDNFSIVECVFVTPVTSLPSRCLATRGGIFPSRYQAKIRVFFTGPLPSNDKEDT
jgi:hypothetical protein